MSFARFVLSSFRLSVSVALRMAVVSAVAIYAFYVGVSFLFAFPLPDRNLVLVAVIVAAILLVPTMLFLYLSAIRAGLVALKASGPPSIGTLAKALLRMMRFNFMFVGFFVVTLGSGISIAYVIIFAPQFVEEFLAASGVKSRADLVSLADTLRGTPLILATFYALGLCLVNGVNGVSMAVTAASAAVRAPGQDVLWGLGRRFWPLFGMTAIFLLAPVIGGTWYLGGLQATVGDVVALPKSWLIAMAAYLIWYVCLITGAKAQAYALTVQEVDRERAEMMAALAVNTSADKPEDLRSMLRVRMDAARQLPKSRSNSGLPSRPAVRGATEKNSTGSVVPLHGRQAGRLADRGDPSHTESGRGERGARVVPFRSRVEDSAAVPAAGGAARRRDSAAGEAPGDVLPDGNAAEPEKKTAADDWFGKPIANEDTE